MFLVILAIWFGYKKGRDTGRNPFLWAAISAGAFIGGQLLGGILIGATFGILEVALNWSVREADSYAFGTSFLSLIPAFIALWLVFRHLDKVLDEEKVDAPPPPPAFDKVE